MRTVTVALGERSYDVLIGSGLLAAVGERTRDAAGGRSAVVITDSNVAPLYAPAVAASLAGAGYVAHVATFPAGEPHKTLATVADLFDQVFALPTPPERTTVVVALGGGVAGDIAGFLAATLLRGVPFVQVPTSLLAMVDSSVGGKTGVDHAAGKNLIGAFHQPRGVFIDTDTLATLPPVEMASGLAECIKHGIIRDASLLAWIEQHAPALAAGDRDALGELIARNVAIKAAVVAADEREGGVRAHLNYGHTIGHAIEAVAGLRGGADTGDYLRHGHCVALGMVAAGRIAVARGLLGESDARRVESILAAVNLPVRLAGLNGAELLGIMRRDKKVLAGAIRFVLPDRALGRAAVFADVSDAEILDAIACLS
ncbi:MAG: 3-dehydroquinate synthase [Planctomycetes bacterium]|nr:3-dehydroquinate synthase [Planctomycetota bacterium]